MDTHVNKNLFKWIASKVTLQPKFKIHAKVLNSQMKSTEINFIRFDCIQIVLLPCFYVDHCFNNNDGLNKINYLSSSITQRDQVVYASMLNVAPV